MSRARSEKALKLAVKKGRLFAWGNMQTEPETLLESRWVRRSACFPAQTGVVDFISVLNHFSMPEKQEMEYVPIGTEAAKRRNHGLRSFIERWMLRLLRHSCACPVCQRLRGIGAQERVIRF